MKSMIGFGLDVIAVAYCLVVFNGYWLMNQELSKMQVTVDLWPHWLGAFVVLFIGGWLTASPYKRKT